MTIPNMLGSLYFQSSKYYKNVVADGMYLVEHADATIDWIIACNCPNYTI